MKTVKQIREFLKRCLIPAKEEQMKKNIQEIDNPTNIVPESFKPVPEDGDDE